MKKVFFFLLTALLSFCMRVSSQVQIDKPIQLTGSSGNRAVTNLELPVNGTDAASKDYVDAMAGGSTHRIGDLYQGGIIVAVWSVNNVEHGIIASLTDIPTSGNVYTMKWNGSTGYIIGNSVRSPTDGQSNTSANVAIIGVGNTPDRAVTVCDGYTNPDTGTGVYSDWYLPAILELRACLDAMPIVNKIIGNTNGFYFGD
ncbi:MAG: hypothetical protein IT216_12535, partial [Saprospiraceae bacterium]|nr:hypothetical protein [Saprospiraceae bacterium]